MAKRKQATEGEKWDALSDEALAKVEAQLEAETGHDVVKTGDNPPTFVETEKSAADNPPVDDAEDCWLYNEDTGEVRLTRVRAGYAPAPMPFGFRVAKNEEIPGK